MKYFDTLETRDPEQRERDLFAALPKQVAHAMQHAPAFAELYKGVDAKQVSSRAALAQLPVIRKHELIERQKTLPPFGGLNATPLGRLGRVFSSPGPIYDPEGTGADWWRFARSLHAAGFRAGDLVHNTFSYHFTPAGFMTDGAARKLGCAVFPAGVGQTEMQVQAIAELKPAGYIGTPSFLKIILEKADELKADVTSLKKAVVSGEAFFPNQKALCAERGIDALQAYGTADLGLVAYETEAREGLVLEESLILEIVRPGTGDPVAPGEVGEVVVTSFNTDYPLIRFGTGDLSAVLPGISPCGRSNVRIKGWMGRADQTAKVKGMFVHPSQVAEVLKRHPLVAKARLVVDNETGQDRMTLRCEVAGAPNGLAEALAASIRDITKLRGEVALCQPGELPNDGKVIDDARKYD
ncbi:MAG: phenylacetate--CoA ligase family protein [Rhodocyclaceae bacterium]|uniref:Phenylacetate--CoA ligase family protein n=1 Tax=Candidatus Desulfobacillus denitrificans TaxID=2608985 RepID=A0A809RCA4_9PROT|nr:phenylacetate--CoA ligase family protein [Rhodocyclaceae bacterium]BBO21985.1 phenylacetate--CoA ligase family protein [Candidatus Desulfobacillus denitrificans]GJQ55901.1 MAG: phenylacetate--CoA ligase [Rhodocyclaceae bacterium]